MGARAWIALSLCACGAATEGRWQPGGDPLLPVEHPSNSGAAGGPAPDTSAPLGTNPVPTEQALAVICAPEPLWVVGDIAPADVPVTRSSLLVPAEDSRSLLWTVLEETPASSYFDFESGSALRLPADEILPSGDALPPWRTLVGSHSVGINTVRRILAAHTSTQLQPTVGGDRGGLSVTPSGHKLVHSHCAGSHSQLDVWDLRDPSTEPQSIVLSQYEACPISTLLLDDVAILADTSALRYVDLTTGATLFSRELPGPAGRIDLAKQGERVVLSVVTGNLSELQPGLFNAHAIVLFLPPLQTLREQSVLPNPEIDVTPFSFVIGGALVIDPVYEPGFISIPSALHPGGEVVASFSSQEDLVLLDVRGSVASVLQAAELPDVVRTESPRVTGLPAALDFSQDGRFLASVRGRQLSVFECAEQSQ